MLSMFRFLGFFLKTPNLKSAGVDLYRGAARILLLLLHDFPDFLAEYYFTICDVIPPNCIQLRNVVLSAFPPNVALPDPYRTSQLESIPEMGPIPPVLSDFTTALHARDLRGTLDQVLFARAPPSALQSIKEYLYTLDSPSSYDLSAINALVMYVGVSSVAQAKARSGSPLFVSTDPGVVLLQYLATSLDLEGKVAFPLTLSPF
jgi:CCR4-NOT transcription complex subunit 1